MRFALLTLTLLACTPRAPRPDLEARRAAAAEPPVVYVEVADDAGREALDYLRAQVDKAQGLPRPGFDPFTSQFVDAGWTMTYTRLAEHPSGDGRAMLAEDRTIRAVHRAEVERLRALEAHDAAAPEDRRHRAALEALDASATYDPSWMSPAPH